MAKRKTTSERVLDILMRKVRSGQKLSKHEREILAVVTHEGLKKDREFGRKRKSTKKRTTRRTAHKKRRSTRKKRRR